MRALRFLLWNLWARWKQLRSERAMLALAVVGLPMLIGVYVGMGAGIGGYLEERFATGDAQAFADGVRTVFLVYAAVVVLVAPAQTLQSHLVEKQRRALRHLRQLPFSDLAIYGIRTANEALALTLFILPLAAVPALQLFSAGLPLVPSVALFLAPFLILFWGLVGARGVMVAVLLLAPRRLLGWRLAICIVLAAVVALARPLGERLKAGGDLRPDFFFPVTDWLGLLVRWHLEGERGAALLLGASVLAGTVLVLALDFLVYRAVLLRRGDRVELGAAGSGGRPLLERAAGGLLDRLPARLGSWPLRGPAKREFLWLARDPMLSFAFLIPLLTMVFAFSIVEILLPSHLFATGFSLTTTATVVTLSFLLATAGTLLPAISLPAEGNALRRLLDGPQSEVEILRGRLLGVYLPAGGLWLAAYGLPFACFGAPEGLSPWAAWLGGPLVVLLAAFLTSAIGVALGALCGRTGAKNPLLSVSLVGLAVQYTAASLAVASLGAGLWAPFALGPSFVIFTAAIALIWTVTAVFLATEARRALRRRRLRQAWP